MPPAARRDRVSNAPSREYRQHHKVEPPAIDGREFRPAWRRVDQIERLAITQTISLGEYRAALAFRSLVDRAARDALRAADLLRTAIARGEGHRPPAAMSERQAEAIARLAILRRRLGEPGFETVWLIVIESATWARLAAQLRCCPKTARRRGLAALARLAATRF